MKNENIRKINTLGKVSRILLIIMRVALIIGIVGCLIATFAFMSIPKTDVITADGTVSAQITVDCVQLPPIFGGDIIDDVLDIDKDDIDFALWGTDVEWLVEENKVDNNLIYDIQGKFDVDNSSTVVWKTVRIMAIGAVTCVVMLIAVIFGGKLAKALEICTSPFEENVLKSMKNFAFSLIPVAVFEIFWNGVSLVIAVIVIAVIMFAFIFNYGAELQKESDETV